MAIIYESFDRCLFSSFDKLRCEKFIFCYMKVSSMIELSAREHLGSSPIQDG